MKPRTAPCRIGGVDMDLPLERGIKIPPVVQATPGTGLGGYYKHSTAPNRWPWKHMRNNDSVLIPYRHARYDHIRSSFCAYAKFHPGMRFVVRSLNEGIRVWRKDNFAVSKKTVDRPKLG